MKLILAHKDFIALIASASVVIGFFIAGLFNVLDYFIVKALLFSGFAIVVTITIGFGLKNEIKKNRPDD